MMGLSLRNVVLSAVDNKKKKTVYKEMGEMLFTHFGVSGPLVLSASSHMRDMSEGRYTLCIDLKPSLDEKTLDTRLLSDFAKYCNKNMDNAMCDLLPSKMIVPFLIKCGIAKETKTNSLTKEQRRTILENLKCFKVEIDGFRPVEEAIITSGGVAVKEVNPSTMESKLVENLYFAGEILDVDAYTGGFNLQIAFSTGFVAGKSAATKEVQ
jgi:predicted Rossmann fold flavoprotein